MSQEVNLGLRNHRQAQAEPHHVIATWTDQAGCRKPSVCICTPENSHELSGTNQRCQKYVSLAMWTPHSVTQKSRHFTPRSSRENPAMLACDARNGMFLTSSNAKYLRFGLSLQSGLRCACWRCQSTSNPGEAMRATKSMSPCPGS